MKPLVASRLKPSNSSFTCSAALQRRKSSVGMLVSDACQASVGSITPGKRRPAVFPLTGWGELVVLFWSKNSPVRMTLALSEGCHSSLLRKLITCWRSEEHTSELQSLMRISYAVFCLKKKTTTHKPQLYIHDS